LARKILLADDSVTAQNMGRKILADAGYDVITVNNGSAALKRITEVKPDLIVLDVYMPGYSGLEVCQRLKDADETAHIPVLLTVGKLEPFKPEEARRVRADGHIVKPFEASELLTAITRLEDRMVPQSDGVRFSSSVSGVERFGGGGSGNDGGGKKQESAADTDTGWKSRLRFPSKKKKEEPEPEPEPEDIAAAAPFRDFRKGKGKTGASFKVKDPPPPGQEPGLVPDIPRDITPEELDALSALAAQLDGPVPAAENLASMAEKMDPVEAPPAEVVSAKAEVAKTEVAKAEVEGPAAVGKAAQEEPKQESKEVETTAPPAANIVEPAAAAVAAPALVVEAKSNLKIEEKSEEKSETPIPAAQVVAAAEPAAAAETPSSEVKQQPPHSGTQNPETPAAVVTVDAALLAQPPAPVDKSDEPRFASAPSAVEQTADKKIVPDSTAQDSTATAKETVEAKPVAAVTAAAPVQVKVKTEVTAPAEAAVAKTPETKPEESAAQPSPAVALNPEKIEQPVVAASSVPEPPPEEKAPSDEELAEALRLLTPTTGRTDVSTAPSHGTLVAAGQLLAEEAARHAASGARWVAQPVALSSEEAAMSLEAEMFRTFAAVPTTIPTAVPDGEIRPTRVTGVSAITAAVESRLAAAELAASAKASPKQEANSGSSQPDSEATAVERSIVEAPAEAIPAVSNAASAVVDEIAAEKVEPKKIAEEKLEAAPKDSPAKVVEEMPVEEVASATFADAVGRDEAEAAVNEEDQNSSSDAGGEEAMGNDGKAKSGKSNWRQIHTGPANAGAPGDVVEAAKQGANGAEAPKAMAAAASADGSTAASPTDASSIASIVDSVMADLRPKIVEEIAKKLAGK
jgi:CheY-like chemotaxis protein